MCAIFIGNRQNASGLHKQHVDEDDYPNEDKAKQGCQDKRAAAITSRDILLRGRAVSLCGHRSGVYLECLGRSLLAPLICFNNSLFHVDAG